MVVSVLTSVTGVVVFSSEIMILKNLFGGYGDVERMHEIVHGGGEVQKGLDRSFG